MLPHQSTKISFKLALLLALIQLIQQVAGSGIFEINFSSLVDNLGRDLREDCCNWQQKLAASQQQQQQQQQSLQQQQTSNQQNFQPCDPTKCQLIMRICVKNYQTQIDPSQCTFGELSAQVTRPNEANLFANYPPIQFNPAAPLAASSPTTSSLHARRMFQSTSTVTNIHHQRMKQQQQLLSNTNLHFPAPFQNNKQQQQHQQTSGSSGPRFYPSQRGLRSIAFNQPISFPFNFTWPGEFSLIVDAWFETPTELPGQVSLPGFSMMASQQQQQQQQQQTTYDLYKKQLIIKHSMHGWLGVKNEWTNDVHKTDLATLTYSYRITCQPNYYGEKCNILCRPRDGVFGHFTCSPQGDIVCRPGWQGSYCLDPICSPGCHKDQGNCSRPNECNCRIGWEGPSCEQCTRFPGCVHGYCSKPYECLCQEGWGGLLCNEDLNYCTNHKPCKNEATCTNTFDSNGAGSYTCDCLPGFTGKDCETNLLAREIDFSLYEVPTQEQIQAFSNENNSSSIIKTNNNPSKQASLATASPIQPSIMDPNNHHHHPPQAKQHRNIVPPTSTTTTTTPTPTTAASAVASSPITQAPQIQAQHNILHQQQQNHQQVNAPVGPFMHHYTTQPVTAQQHPSGLPFDNRVVAAYGIIIVCMVILVVVLLFRIFYERTNQRQWHQESNQVEDVATLQNHQNIYKSRTSLSTSACTTDKMMPYDTLDSSPESSSASSSSSSSSITSSTAAAYGRHHHHHHHHQQQQQQQQQQNHMAHHHITSPSTAHERRAHYRSHHNLHHQPPSSGASSNNGGPLNPPPPYTISHSHPNSTTYMDYNNSIYNLSLANHHQAATSLYGVHSTYGQIPAAATATTATNSIYQSPYYVICRLVDPVDPLGAAAAAAAASAAAQPQTAPAGNGKASSQVASNNNNNNNNSCSKSGGNKFKVAANGKG